MLQVSNTDNERKATSLEFGYILLVTDYITLITLHLEG